MFRRVLNAKTKVSSGMCPSGDSVPHVEASRCALASEPHHSSLCTYCRPPPWTLYPPSGIPLGHLDRIVQSLITRRLTRSQQ